MYLILMVYACLISCSLINKSKCHSLAYFNLRWTCVVILHKGILWLNDEWPFHYGIGGLPGLIKQTQGLWPGLVTSTTMDMN